MIFLYIQLFFETQENVIISASTRLNPPQPASTRLNPPQPASTRLNPPQPASTRLNLFLQYYNMSTSI